MTYWLCRLAAWLLPHLPEALGYPLFGLFGFISYILNSKARARLTANLRVVLGDTADEHAVTRAAREAFRQLAWNYYDLFHLPGLTPTAIRSRMTIEGFEHLLAAVRHGKGVILASMHFGNTELLMQVPALFDAWQFALLVEKMADSRIYEIVSRIRASQGMSMIAVDEPLKIIRFLKQQGVIGIAVDRDVTGSGIVVNFFGKPARIPDGAVRLAQRTGALIVPAYGWRAQQRQTHIQVLPPLQLTRTDDPTHDTLVNTRKLVEVFEPIVKTHAGQWMAFHPIFDF